MKSLTHWITMACSIRRSQTDPDSNQLAVYQSTNPQLHPDEKVVDIWPWKNQRQIPGFTHFFDIHSSTICGFVSFPKNVEGTNPQPCDVVGKLLVFVASLPTCSLLIKDVEMFLFCVPKKKRKSLNHHGSVRMFEIDTLIKDHKRWKIIKVAWFQ